MTDGIKFALPDSQQFRAFYAKKRRRSRLPNGAPNVVTALKFTDNSTIKFSDGSTIALGV